MTNLTKRPDLKNQKVEGLNPDNLYTVTGIHGTFEDEKDGAGRYPQPDALNGTVTFFPKTLLVESIDNGATWYYDEHSLTHKQMVR
jgi:hypothetical protein